MQLLDIFKADCLHLKEENRKEIEAQTVPVNLDKLNEAVWPKIRYLCLHEDVFLDHSFCRLSHDHSWLIILGKKVDLNVILSRCCNNLVFLRIDECLSTALDFSRMKQLRFLHIEHICISNKTAIPLQGLNELTELETLSLEGTFSNTDLDVATMKSLTLLHIRHNQQLRRVSGFAALGKLKEFEICNAREITELDFSGARNLECLHLKQIPKLCQLPELHLFRNLRRIRLSSVSAVQKVVNLSGLLELEYLDLSCNKELTYIDGLEGLHKLTHINLADTSLRRIPDALRQKSLKTLNLSKLELDFLPDWLLDMGLDFSLKQTKAGICLYHASVKNADMDIFRSRDRIVQWFDSQKSRPTSEGTPIPAISNGSVESNALLDSILDGCRFLQSNPICWGTDENNRTRMVLHTLSTLGYNACSQDEQGVSRNGIKSGQLDLFIRGKHNEPLTILEALIVQGCSRTWDEHLERLIKKYDSYGLPELYLLTYIDCSQEKFGEICAKYDQRILTYTPPKFTRITDPIEVNKRYGYTKIVKCRYKIGSHTPLVYHIFLRMGPP